MPRHGFSRPMWLLVMAFCASTLAPIAQGQSAESTASQPRAKYVFLFIGDGMGLAQRTAGELYLAAIEGRADQPWRTQLAMNSLPVAGMITTYSHNATITDSAAAGTALACGAKADNGAIAMDPAGRPLATIAEQAKRNGMHVGIITSVSIDHATPASFYAHQASRGSYYEIAMQLADSGMDYFAGGKPIGEKGKEADAASPYDAARAAGYTLAVTDEEFRALEPGAERVWVCVNDFPYEMDRAANAPSLADYTRKAIELLDGEKGFFMMVEGGRIDWACHNNNAAVAVMDVLALDKAVAEAVAFAAKHPDETLIVVTADHETGGMTLGSTGAASHTSLLALDRQKHSTVGFDERIKQLREDAANSEQTLDEYFPKALAVVEEAFGLTDLTDVESEKLRLAYMLSMNDLPRKGRDEDTYRRYAGGDPLTAACVHLVGLRAGIGWTTWSHTASPVPVTAGGAGSELFGGCYDNTGIPRRIAKAMGMAEEFATASASVSQAELQPAAE